MTESKRNIIQRHRYYNEMLTIPKIKEVLNEVQMPSNVGTYRDYTKNALNLLAATFGIALSGKIFANPFLALTSATTASLWGNNKDDLEARDTWGEIVWCITHYSITTRMEKMKTRQNPQMNMEETRLLRRAEKLSQLEDEPASIATSIPRHICGTWDMNVTSKRTKQETIKTTLDILRDSNDELEIPYSFGKSRRKNRHSFKTRNICGE